MKSYELTYLISAETSRDEVTNKISSLIQEEGGILLSRQALREQNLGYEIKGRNSAFLGLLGFQIDSQKIELVKKKLKEQTHILRFVILKKEAPSAKIKRLPKGIRKTLKKEKVELKEIEEKLEEILDEPK